MASNELASVALGSAGTGYEVGDVFVFGIAEQTISSSDFRPGQAATPCKVEILTIGALGAIATLGVESGGGGVFAENLNLPATGKMKPSNLIGQEADYHQRQGGVVDFTFAPIA